MIKETTLLLSLVYAATPKTSNVDPYAKYDLMLDHAQANIIKTQNAIEEIKVMNEQKFEEVKSQMDSIEVLNEQMEEQMNVIHRVFNTLSVEMPKSLEEWVEDSIRIENMNRINSSK